MIEIERSVATMRKQINPVVAVIVVIVAALGCGLLAWKLVDTTHHEEQVIVKPADPNDPKFHPNPKLGLAGGAGTNTDPGSAKGGAND